MLSRVSRIPMTREVFMDRVGEGAKILLQGGWSESSSAGHQALLSLPPSSLGHSFPLPVRTPESQTPSLPLHMGT